MKLKTTGAGTRRSLKDRLEMHADELQVTYLLSNLIRERILPSTVARFVCMSYGPLFDCFSLNDKVIKKKKKTSTFDLTWTSRHFRGLASRLDLEKFLRSLVLLVGFRCLHAMLEKIKRSIEEFSSDGEYFNDQTWSNLFNAAMDQLKQYSSIQIFTKSAEQNNKLPTSFHGLMKSGGDTLVIELNGRIMKRITIPPHMRDAGKYHCRVKVESNNSKSISSSSSNIKNKLSKEMLPNAVPTKMKRIRKFFRTCCAHCGDRAKALWHSNLKIFRVCSKCSDMWKSSQKFPTLSLEQSAKIVSKFDRVLKDARVHREKQWWHVFIRSEAKRNYENRTKFDVDSYFGSEEEEEEEEKEEGEEMAYSDVVEADKLKYYDSDETYEEDESLWKPGEDVCWINRRDGHGSLRWSKIFYGKMVPELETDDYYVAKARNGLTRHLWKTDIVSWRIKYTHWRNVGRERALPKHFRSAFPEKHHTPSRKKKKRGNLKRKRKKKRKRNNHLNSSAYVENYNLMKSQVGSSSNEDFFSGEEEEEEEKKKKKKKKKQQTYVQNYNLMKAQIKSSSKRCFGSDEEEEKEKKKDDNMSFNPTPINNDGNDDGDDDDDVVEKPKKRKGVLSDPVPMYQVASPRTVDMTTTITTHNRTINIDTSEPVYIPMLQQGNKRTKPSCVAGVHVRRRDTTSGGQNSWLAGLVLSSAIDEEGSKMCEVLWDDGTVSKISEKNLFPN